MGQQADLLQLQGGTAPGQHGQGVVASGQRGWRAEGDGAAMAVTLGPGPTMFSFESPLAPARGGDQAAAPLLDEAPSPWESGRR